MNILSDRYDEFVKSHPDEMKDAISVLKREMERRNCKFGDKVVPTFLKPIFLSAPAVKSIKEVLAQVMSILEKVSRLYFTNPELQDYFYLNERAAELMKIDHGYSRNIVISRPDAFWVNGALRFVEFNCDSPAGPGYTDLEEEIFQESFPMRSFAPDCKFSPPCRMKNLLKALLGAYKEFSGGDKKPNIAIVDWRDVKTQVEFKIIQAYFQKNGYETTIADPRDLKLVDGRLQHNDFKIDLVYRRVIFRELVEKLDDIQDFVQAYRDGIVCVVNPFRSRLASIKAILAIITDQKKFKDLFTEEENKVIKKYIPWTRRVIDMQTNYEENMIFLRKHIAVHKDSLVLKPSDSYGGKDVIIGRECEQSDWDILINSIMSKGEDWVVQKYVDITQVNVPVLEGDSVELRTKKFNLNPFIYAGEYAGSMARLSDQSVINVTAGGGMVPVVEYHEENKRDDH